VIFDLNPTPYLLTKVDGYEKLNKHYDELLKSEEYRPQIKDKHSKVNSTYAHGCAEDQQDIYDELMDSIFPYFAKYINSFGLSTNKINFGMDVWHNIYNKGDHQSVHSHCSNNNVFSFIYFVKLPSNSGDVCFFGNDLSKHFYYTGFNDILINPITDKFVPKVETGSLIIFPSHREHYVSFNESGDERITISGNIGVKLDADI
jgi:hypothetical protein